MGQPRKWGSESERKAAERAAANGATEEETEEPESPLVSRPGRDAPPVEEYVAREVEITRADLAKRNPGRDVTDDPEGRDRLARSEAYARWRHAGYLDGTVASL